VIEGYRPLQARLEAIGDSKLQMGFVASIVVGELKRNIVHRTSGTSRTIHVTAVTDSTARIEGSPVARWLDEGTGLYGPRRHRIVPRSGKVMRWTAGPSGSLTLAGRKRSGKAGTGAGPVFARSTRGMKGRPFIQRSIQSAAGKLGVELGGQIVDEWNRAA